ncbi:uncharacterized protein LOC110832813 [Zootermopsis nevadensis]|uniref:MD-2-related lipid-recognition domain-containing protein n=1 Tax=Zootermopsis nevadensis TaxID=136037 RepID=A0A067RBY0_ZOONE|nr:uncharacterized protein LOC110832813 [Zootermopsis nevadensis]KDR16198.1 hypothetical protein L798_09614 [Zootermopsis nevadensis]
MSVGRLVTSTLVFVIATCLIIYVETAPKKRNYVLQVTRVDKPYGDGKYVSFKSLKAAKFNRTMSVLKGTFSFLQDIPEDTTVVMETYQKIGGGNYGKGPIALPETSLCNFIAADDLVYAEISRCTGLPRKCPLKKIDINIDNYDINKSNLPPELPPPNEWMAELNLTHKKTKATMLSIRLYFTIEHKGNAG